jgi:hypothetical protein
VFSTACHFQPSLIFVNLVENFERSLLNGFTVAESSGLYYKPITIVNDNSSVVNKLQTSLIDDARVIIYDSHMFIEYRPLYFSQKDTRVERYGSE